eukprot:gene6448-3078_t
MSRKTKQLRQRLTGVSTRASADKSSYSHVDDTQGPSANAMEAFRLVQQSHHIDAVGERPSTTNHDPVFGSARTGLVSDSENDEDESNVFLEGSNSCSEDASSGDEGDEPRVYIYLKVVG